MPGVTIASSYGTAGSVIAPAVARELGLPLLDRAIIVQVTARLDVSQAEAARAHRSLADRFCRYSPHWPAVCSGRGRTPRRARGSRTWTKRRRSASRPSR